MRHLSRDWVLGLLVTAAGAVLTLPLHAQNPSSNESPGGVIRACVQKGGQLRLIDARENCKRAEELVIWNVRGPRGVTGPAGKNGANGSPGAPGKEGAPGRDGANGSPGIPGKQGPPGKDGEPGRDGRDGGNGSPGAIIVGSLAFGCEGSTFSISAVGAAVRIPGTNFFVDVTQMRLESAPGNTSPGPKPKKSKYFPFQIYNVPPGTWALEAGLVRIALAESDPSSNSSSFAPLFRPLASVGHIVTHAGALVSLGEINLDTSCAVPPIEVCGNGIDDDGNDAVDENCPCTGASCVPATRCEDEDMVTCGDGTCRSSAAACPPAGGPPPPPAACTTLTDLVTCEARADCRAIIAGTNCHRPDGTTCQSGDASCICEAPFVFQACVGR